MGGFFSSQKYSVEDHAPSDRTMYDEYVAGDKFHDMTGKVVAITGTSAGGLGFYAAEAAIKKGTKVLVLLNRDSKSAKAGEEGLQQVKKDAEASTEIKTVVCDMQDLAVVKKAGEEVKAIADSNGGLDVLICNAGIMATRDKRTKDGFEVQMQTNQLSHFLLSSIVWPSLVMASESRSEARLVTHSSSARDGPSRNLQEKFFVKSEPNTLGGDSTWFISEAVLGSDGPWQRYHQTKLANSCFAMAVHKKAQEKGLNVKAMSADPGLAASNLQVSSTRGDGLMSDGLAKMLFNGRGHSAPNGSLDICMSAYSPEAKSGDFYAPKDAFHGPPAKTIDEGKAVKKGSEKLTLNEDNIANVWKWCEESLDIKFDI